MTDEADDRRSAQPSGSAPVLDDEAPPEVPDISSDPPPATQASPSGIGATQATLPTAPSAPAVVVDEDGMQALARMSGRAPPPKPARRASISSLPPAIDLSELERSPDSSEVATPRRPGSVPPAPVLQPPRPRSNPPPAEAATARSDRPPAPDGVQISVAMIPSAPRPPQIAMPNDAVPESRPPESEPPKSKPNMMAMRIIAVGKATQDDPPELDAVDVQELLPSREHVQTIPDTAGDAPEIDEVEAAPDSEEPESIEAHPLSMEAQPEAMRDGPAKEPGAAKPPPPPKRQKPAGAKPADSKPASERAESTQKPRRAWWEDVFGEDFVRAQSKLTVPQVKREVDFIEESLGVAPGGVVLDLGCGSGHHSVELAGRGYGVVGYDLSLYQLSLAADVAQEAEQKINFLQGDMREMAFEEMFDGVFCWNTTFGYFEEDKNLAVAQRVFRALRPGGMFLLDVANRDFAAAQQPCQTWYEGDACVCMDDMSVDFITSRLKVKRSLILDDGRTRECTYSVRLYSLHELGKLLHDVGFRITEASGDPAHPGVFFGANSSRVIILAQKP